MSKDLNTPERIKKTAEAASHLYKNPIFESHKESAELDEEPDMRLTEEEREAFNKSPFSKKDMAIMANEHYMEETNKKVRRQKKRQREIEALSPGKMDTFEESEAMKRGEDTDMNIDGRTSPAPTLEKNPFSTPENSPKRKKDSIENFTKAVFSPKPKKKGGGHMYPALKNYIKRSKKKSKKSKKSKKNSKKKSKKKSIKAKRRNKKSKK